MHWPVYVPGKPKVTLHVLRQSDRSCIWFNSFRLCTSTIGADAIAFSERQRTFNLTETCRIENFAYDVFQRLLLHTSNWIKTVEGHQTHDFPCESVSVWLNSLCRFENVPGPTPPRFCLIQAHYNETHMQILDRKEKWFLTTMKEPGW
jgi:hypothetical protein